MVIRYTRVPSANLRACSRTSQALSARRASGTTRTSACGDQACSSTLRAELSHGMPSRFAGEQRNQVRSLCAGSSAVVHGVERCLFQTVRTGFAGREDPIGYLGPGDMVSDRDAPLVKCASGPCDDAPLLAEDPMGQSPHAALRGASPLGG
jgi:hypothetical protein